ncbi:hypothetical protein [Flammeovirga sp. EKP202]|uniref:hypothetical protein n=1 Tax=Flammeovirga sp. EKP202 TaxID=2770592 RepID=UPI00165FE498|nr:hypothetical protein [Flammeovirga sp. EKP202]MBD0403019.1 hypothetical protein [Flammeovirga sp. EKP202]
MKSLLLTITLILTALTFSHAQRIEAEKKFGGYKFTQNGEYVTMKVLVQTMESNKEAYLLMKQARSNNILAGILGGAGGFMVGWTLGGAVGGGEPTWALAGVGAGLIVTSIPIATSANKKAKKAVDLYNADFDSTPRLEKTSQYKFKPEFEIKSKGTGIALSMAF